MKKTLCILLTAAALLLCLTACNENKTTLNDHNIEVARQTVELVDAYLAGEVPAKEAGTGVDALYEDVDVVEEGGIGFASIDRSFLQTTLKDLAAELKGAADEDLVREYRDKIASLAKL